MQKNKSNLHTHGIHLPNPYKTAVSHLNVGKDPLYFPVMLLKAFFLLWHLKASHKHLLAIMVGVIKRCSNYAPRTCGFTDKQLTPTLSIPAMARVYTSRGMSRASLVVKYSSWTSYRRRTGSLLVYQLLPKNNQKLQQDPKLLLRSIRALFSVGFSCQIFRTLMWCHWNWKR